MPWKKYEGILFTRLWQSIDNAFTYCLKRSKSRLMVRMRFLVIAIRPLNKLNLHEIWEFLFLYGWYSGVRYQHFFDIYYYKHQGFWNVFWKLNKFKLYFEHLSILEPIWFSITAFSKNWRHFDFWSLFSRFALDPSSKTRFWNFLRRMSLNKGEKISIDK